MGVMPLLVICSIVVAGGFLIAFLWATKTGQYDDVVTPSITVTFEDGSSLRDGATEERA